MFKVIFSKTYDNSSYIRNNVKAIVEDYFLVQDNKFCVADGVTKDLLNGEVTGYPETMEEIDRVMKNYPNPSGSFDAAKITCDSFVELISKYDESQISKDQIFDTVVNVNKNVWEINKDLKPDYISNDLHCCTAAGGIITGNTLYCFNVCDSNITVLDENINPIFSTFNDHVSLDDYLEDFNWQNKETRQMARRDFRNKHNVINGKDLSYGAISGEENVKDYIYTYEVDLSNAKYICAYSDGCEPNFSDTEEIKKLINDPESIKNSGKEKTLIIYEKV